jgi:hypothetical protein
MLKTDHCKSVNRLKRMTLCSFKRVFITWRTIFVVGGIFGRHGKKQTLTSLVREDIRKCSYAIWMTCSVYEAAHNISCAQTL